VVRTPDLSDIANQLDAPPVGFCPVLSARVAEREALADSPYLLKVLVVLGSHGIAVAL